MLENSTEKVIMHVLMSQTDGVLKCTSLDCLNQKSIVVLWSVKSYQLGEMDPWGGGGGGGGE